MKPRGIRELADVTVADFSGVGRRAVGFLDPVYRHTIDPVPKDAGALASRIIRKSVFREFLEAVQDTMSEAARYRLRPDALLRSLLEERRVRAIRLRQRLHERHQPLRR